MPQGSFGPDCSFLRLGAGFSCFLAFSLSASLVSSSASDNSAGVGAPDGPSIGARLDGCRPVDNIPFLNFAVSCFLGFFGRLVFLPDFGAGEESTASSPSCFSAISSTSRFGKKN